MNKEKHQKCNKKEKNLIKTYLMLTNAELTEKLLLASQEEKNKFGYLMLTREGAKLKEKFESLDYLYHLLSTTH